jgi:hypothetical protein
MKTMKPGQYNVWVADTRDKKGVQSMLRSQWFRPEFDGDRLHAAESVALEAVRLGLTITGWREVVVEPWPLGTEAKGIES